MSLQNNNSEKKNTLWLVLAFVNIGLIAFLIITQKDVLFPSSMNVSPTIEASITNTSSVSEMSEDKIVINPITTSQTEQSKNLVMIFSLYVNQKSQLFLFEPEKGIFTSLFDDPYERIHPAISYDQEKLAYSAKKNGYWDLFILDLVSGEEIRLTDSTEYDGAPSWSPDNQYIAYETYKNGNLDIFIQDLTDLSIAPIELTTNEFAQFSPDWSPKGDQIAFVSSESGDEEIFLANLNTLDKRFTPLTDRPNNPDLNPTWSNEGEIIFWSSENNGYPVILSTSITDNFSLVSELSIGTDIEFNGQIQTIIQQESNKNFLLLKQTDDNDLVYPPFLLPGDLSGFTSVDGSKVTQFILESLSKNASYVETKPSPNIQSDRAQLINLENLELDHHYLHESVIDPFNLFRSTISSETGWDFFYQLDKSYIPLTEPSIPGMVEEWLFTGRAFEFNPLSIHAGLVVTIKEERNGQTYWRIMIKSRYQDGSQGLPLRQMPFDLSSRFNNDPQSYEAGGKKISIPEGYWVDITKIGRSVSWERVPAIGNWKNYFESTRFNQFVYSENLDWYSAMKQLYPSEAIKTPSPLPTNQLTPTNSPTIRYFRSPTVTSTQAATIQPTNRPTWTPIP